MPERNCDVCNKLYECCTSRTCSFDCRGTYAAKEQWKVTHAKWRQETPDETKELMRESFEKFFDKAEGCWLWKGGKKNKMPYGCFVFRHRNWIAHRASYYLYKGELPPKALVLHSCDNASCVNPDHLRLGTHIDNQRDKIIRGRGKVEKLTIDQVKEIKALIATGKACLQISKLYGVSNVNILNIKHGKIWTWV